MTADDRIPPNVRARLRDGENPYAFIQFEGDGSPMAEPTRVCKVHPSRTPQARTVAGQQGDLFAPAREAERGRGGNPYASLASIDDEDTPASVPAAITAPAIVLSTSKSEFRSRCMRIFRHYVPALERRRLRDYMRDFISRNESRSSRVRYLLLQSLTKYDLSDITGAVPRFNREDEPLSEQKLREIERSIGPDEK